MNKFPDVFTPLQTAKFSLPSRFVRSATAERLPMGSEAEGEALGLKYAALAAGGVSLIITGHIAVHPTGRLHASMPVITPANIKAWRAAAVSTHKVGALVFFQLNHGGGRCRPQDPSAAVCVSRLPERPRDGMLGEELSGARIYELESAYAQAARLAREAGADGVQIHAAHGYLVSQFMSPLTNRRTDEWGGALENRSRFLLRVVDAVRRAVGDDFPLGVKLGCCDDDPAGLVIEDGLQAALRLEKLGIDFIEISGGFRADVVQRHVRTGKNEGYYLPFAARFKAALKIPVFGLGGLRSLSVMNDAIASGQCDAIAMCRPLICQPDLPLVLRAGGRSECRGCNLCLVKHDRPTSCYLKK